MPCCCSPLAAIKAVDWLKFGALLAEAMLLQLAGYAHRVRLHVNQTQGTVRDANSTRFLQQLGQGGCLGLRGSQVKSPDA